MTQPARSGEGARRARACVAARVFPWLLTGASMVAACAPLGRLAPVPEEVRIAAVEGTPELVGVPVSVSLDPSQAMPAALQQLVKDGVEEGLSEAGLAVVQPGQAQLSLLVSLGSSEQHVVVSARGRPVDDVSSRYSRRTFCPGGNVSQAVFGRCLGHQLAQGVIDSQATRRAAAAPTGPASSEAAAPRRTALAGKLAVLEFRSSTQDVTRENAQYFSNLIRGAVVRIDPTLQVMTRENLIVLLQATGRDLANCEGECEIDTGRRIGADAIISGDLQRLGSRLKLSLRLHETHEGRLLSSSIASGSTLEQLDDAALPAVEALLAPLR